MLIQKNKGKKNQRIAAIDLMPNDEKIQEILQYRAQLTAKLNEEPDNNLNMSYIQFILGNNEHYGIPYQVIEEVLNNFSITKIPHTPDFITGIINRRGKLLPILNLKTLFNIKETNRERNQYIIIVRDNETTVGIVVDKIAGSDTYDPDLLNPSLSTGYEVKGDYIKGLHNGITAIINISQLFKHIFSKLGVK